MPRKGHPVSIQQVYIADGFADDCDELIHRCSRVDVLNYQTFCIYYKEMKFASVFQGRTSNAEIAELSEELLQIAKYYMVLDTSNFEESVAGLFLVYALLNLQPYPRFASLRLVPDDLPALARLERGARRDRRLDVLFVLGSVLTRGPVQFHVEARPRGMEGSIRKYLDGFCNIDITGIRPKGVYFRQNEELDLIRDMDGIFKRYSQAKGRIPGLQKRVLSYSNDNLAVELGASLKRVINGTVEEGETSTNHHDSVQEIKKRAMQNVVSTVRHLDSAEHRTISPEKKPPSKLKTGANKPKHSKKQAEAKKAKKRMSHISESSEDGTPSDESLEHNEPDEQEIHVEIDSLPTKMTTESNGRVFEIEIIDEMVDDNLTEKENDTLPLLNDEINSKQVEIEIIDSGKQNDLPPLVTKESGFVEIEIFGAAKEQTVESGEKVEIEIEKGKTEVEREDKRDKDKPRKRDRKKKEEKKSSDDVIFKRPLRASPRLKPVLKRDQKKPILKSKFKKMGMLEVANFKEPK